MYRVGEGYDVHKLVDDRDLILGGVKVDYCKGLLGHSDADVLIHAIIDSLLGAAAKNDIGYNFPDSDEKYKNISSLILLKKTRKIITDYDIVNIDSTIICQEPKLRKYIDEMKNNIANALDIDTNKINIKATTEEGLGFTGSKEGIAAKAICMLEEVKNENL